VLADVVRLASAAREQCFTWGPQQHQSTYDRIIAAVMRYSAVVNYAGAIEIPLLPRHPASSLSSASTALRSRRLPPLPAASWLRGHNNSHRRRARTPTCIDRLLPQRRYFQQTLFSTNAHNYYVFVIILYSNRTGRSPPFPTAGPRQQEPPPIFALGGSRPPAIQFPATDIPSSSTPPMFQPTFDTTNKEHLGWDEFGYSDILATMDAPQRAEEVGASQLTQAPPVWTQLTQPQGGVTPAAGGATRDVVGSSQAAMATPSPDQLGLRVVRAPDPWTYDRDQTWADARAVRAKRGRRI
jgi:hypothetical protein